MTSTKGQCQSIPFQKGRTAQIKRTLIFFSSQCNETRPTSLGGKKSVSQIT